MTLQSQSWVWSFQTKLHVPGSTHEELEDRDDVELDDLELEELGDDEAELNDPDEPDDPDKPDELDELDEPDELEGIDMLISLR